jgi:diguanylate cyclase (GGDEF)-like protein
MLVFITQLAIIPICGILIRNLYNKSNLDDLTGQFNRRYFNNKLKDELNKINKNKSNLSLIFVDIDDFKKVNDKYGHNVGDEVLQKISVLLNQNLRRFDTLARWGGEEFAIILPGTTVEEAKIICERLRGVIENYDFSLKISISIGASVASKYINPLNLVSIADKAMYKAKEKKNCVVFSVIA